METGSRTLARHDETLAPDTQPHERVSRLIRDRLYAVRHDVTKTAYTVFLWGGVLEYRPAQPCAQHANVYV
jgi:hypothetical protein